MHKEGFDDFRIIVEGYARPSGSNTKFLASCSTTLILCSGKKILVDPGADEKRLLEGLKKEGLKPSDIDILFLSHYHPDHFLNTALFPALPIHDATTVWTRDGGEEMPNGDKPMDVIPGTHVQILSTPGHREEHASLLINTEKYGKVCVAQDVFWWMDGQQPENPTVEDLMGIHDPFHFNMDSLTESRKKVLELADWIIPGHGKMFKNPSKIS
jgi:glyoxylase-like metal-dependent hydrolase (beta-lactamase superfamily II)